LQKSSAEAPRQTGWSMTVMDEAGKQANVRSEFNSPKNDYFVFLVFELVGR